jgi:tetratricopeptide (TPR) repeat protein
LVRLEDGLLRDALLKNLSPTQQTLHHLRLARLLRDDLAQNDWLRASAHFWQAKALWDQDDRQRLPQLFSKVAQVLAARGELEDAFIWLDRIADCFGDANASQELQGANEVIDALIEKAKILERYGRYHQALSVIEELELLLLTSGDDWRAAHILVTKAWLLHNQPAAQGKAAQLAEEALQLLRNQSNTPSHLLDLRTSIEADALAVLGWIAYQRHDFEIARSHYQQALGLQKRLGNQARLAGLLTNLGLILANLGKANAEAYLKEGLAIREKIGDLVGLGRSLNNIGVFYWQKNRLEDARAAYRWALGIQQKLENWSEMALLQSNLGALAFAEGHYHEALSAYQEAKLLFERAREYISSDLLYNLAEVQCHLGNKPAALFALQELQARLAQSPDPELEQDCAILLKKLRQ